MWVETPEGLLWKEEATEAVLAFLRDTRACRTVMLKPLEEEEGRTVKGRKVGQACHRMYFPLFYFLCSLIFPFFPLEALGRRRGGSPTMTGYAGLGQDKDNM